MRLNDIKPAPGAKKPAVRVGRGRGSGLGKTCGRGHKGQHARAGGFHRIGFEGGQMPMQRRLPKFGFTSHFEQVAEIRLWQLEKLVSDVVDLDVLKAIGLIPQHVSRAKVIANGEIKRAVVVKGIPVSKGAKAAIEAAGGKVE